MTMRLPEHLRLRLLGRLQLRLLKRLQMRLQLRLQLHFRQPTSFPIALHGWRAKSLPVHVSVSPTLHTLTVASRIQRIVR